MYIPEDQKELRDLLFGFCCEDATDLCDEEHDTPEGRHFICTREKDHKGPHIACGAHEALGIWGNEENINAPSNKEGS